MPERIGILVGQEQSFPEAFIAKVNETPGVRAELARIGGTPERFDAQYRVLIDRISHEVPFYRFHLKAASLAGTYVINDPFWWSADEKFFGYSLATRIGVKVPRTVLLPSKSYIPSIDPQRSLRNLEYPFELGGHHPLRGLPCHPQAGRRWRVEERLPGQRPERAAPGLRRLGHPGDDPAAVHRLRRVRALHLRRARSSSSPSSTTPSAAAIWKPSTTSPRRWRSRCWTGPGRSTTPWATT